MRTWGAAVLSSLVIPFYAYAEGPSASAASASKPDAAAPSQPTASSEACQSFVLSAEALYVQQQFGAAAVVLKKGLASCRTSPAPLARLYVLDGILRLEDLAEVEARGAFAAGIDSDAATTFPEFASPRARRIFDAVKAERMAKENAQKAQAAAQAAQPDDQKPQVVALADKPEDPKVALASTTVTPPLRTDSTTSIRPAQFWSLPWISVGVAATGVVASGVFMGLGMRQSTVVRGTTFPTASDRDGAVSFGNAMNIGAYASGGIAIAAAGVATTLWLLDKPGPKVSLGVVPGSGTYAMLQGEY